MNINTWPIQERPREKLLQQGAHNLSDAELLAIFLRTGVRGKNAVDLARELLTKFGNLKKLFESNTDDFCKINGLGTTKYATLHAALEISKRYLQEKIQDGDAINNPEQVRRLLIAKLYNRQNEIFSALFLDNQHRVICYEEIFHGSINKASIYPREIIKRALTHNSSAIIFAHNHTSGSTKPSENDKHSTNELRQILLKIDVELLDHFIIGGKEIFSFAENGLI